jgi:CRISPR-associated protein Cas1
MTQADASHEPLIRVSALHALAYCQRLFYLEEVEEIRIADASVYAGRTLHAELEQEAGDEIRVLDLSSERLGLVGRIDAVRHRDGSWVAFEHKRGRCRRADDATAMAWESDALQVSAYGMLLEEFADTPVLEGRIRYHADPITVRVPLDDAARGAVLAAVARARALRAATQRPPVADNPRLCLRCSLAPVCLPEEERLAQDPGFDAVRLFPPHPEGQVLHVTTGGTKVGRRGDRLSLEAPGSPRQSFPVREVSSILIHGYGQLTTQALHLCAHHGIAVHWLSGGGRYIGGL